MNKKHMEFVAEIARQLENCGENMDTFAGISVGNFDIHIQVHYGIQYADDGNGELFTPVLLADGWYGDYDVDDGGNLEENPLNGYIIREIASPNADGLWDEDPDLILQFAKDCVRNAIQCGI